MKKSSLILILQIICLIPSTFASWKEYKESILEITSYDGIHFVSGFCVGAGAEEGKFYSIATEISPKVNKEDLNEMLQNDNAVVRVMALVCFSNKGYEIKKMKGDSSKVLATPFGCVGEEITVEEFSNRMIEDLEFRYCYTDPDKAYEIMNQKYEEYIQQNGGEELLTACRFRIVKVFRRAFVRMGINLVGTKARIKGL